MRWYIYKVFYISNINIDSIACHSHSRFIYSNNILFISTYIKYVWNILTFKINLNLNLIKKKILTLRKILILIFLIRDCITYFPFFFFKKSTRNFYFHRTFIHDHEHIENVPRDISNLDPFHVTIPSHCNSFLSLSLSVSKTIVPNFEKIYIPPCPMSPHTPPSLSPRTP